MADALDWGDGSYERFAPSLRPAAHHLLAIAAPAAGERAIDLGCGDGNVTVPLAQAGARVTAIDPSLRLVGVAGERVAEAGHHAATVHAPAEALPLPDGDADLVVSNFGVIFSDEPRTAVREVLRVLAPGGRFVYTAWCPEGPLAEVSALLRQQLPTDDATAASSPLTRGVPTQTTAATDDEASPVAWHAPDFMADLVSDPDAVAIHPGTIDFEAPSAHAWLDELFSYQPAWRAARRHISERRWPSLLEEVIDLFERSSLASDRMVLRSPYVVVEVHPERA